MQNGDVHIYDRDGPPAYLIAWKRFVTLIPSIPSIPAFSAERETANGTKLKCAPIDHAAELLHHYYTRGVIY